MKGSYGFKRPGLFALGVIIIGILAWPIFREDNLLEQRAIPSLDPGESRLGSVSQTLTIPQPHRVVEKGTLSSKVSLFDQLLKAGLTGATVESMIRSLSPEIDFRRIHEGVEWELVFLDSVPVQFTLFLSPTEIFEVHQLFLNPVVVKPEIPVEVEVQYFAGEIQSSLFEAFSAMPSGISLAAKVSDVFAWDIDFYMDPRVGDTFEFLVETAYLEKDGKREFLEYRHILAAEYKGRNNTYEAFLFENEKGKPAYYNRKGQSLVRDVLRSPLKLVRITSRFKGQRFHPVLKKKRAHNGVDYGAPRNTPVMAVADGKVIHAGWYGGAGRAIVLSHKGKMITQYFHLNSIPRGLKKGSRVRQGQTIGYVGKTGLATGYHLHFGMKIRGKYVNPLRQKFQPGVPISKTKMPDFLAKVKEYDYLYQTFSGPIQMAGMRSTP